MVFRGVIKIRRKRMLEVAGFGGSVITAGNGFSKRVAAAVGRDFRS